MAQIIKMKESSNIRWRKASDCVSSGRLKEALDIFESLLEDGDLGVYTEIGNLFELGGGGIERNLDTARKWYMKSIEETDDDYGYVLMARLALNGFTDAGTPDDAIEYLRIADSTNNELATLFLGLIYYFGGPVPKDMDCAAKFLKKSSEQGYLLSQRLLSVVEIQQGHIIHGLRLNIKARWQAYKLSKKYPPDYRLKYYYTHFRY